jgi:hypothetical protein
MPSLPSRQSLRGAAATPAPAPMPVPVRVATPGAAPARALTPAAPGGAPAPGQERVVPGYVPDDSQPAWDERLGPLGITLIAVGACAVAWLLTALLL